MLVYSLRIRIYPPLLPPAVLSISLAVFQGGVETDIFLCKTAHQTDLKKISKDVRPSGRLTGNAVDLYAEKSSGSWKRWGRPWTWRRFIVSLPGRSLFSSVALVSPSSFPSPLLPPKKETDICFYLSIRLLCYIDKRPYQKALVTIAGSRILQIPAEENAIGNVGTAV